MEGAQHSGQYLPLDIFFCLVFLNGILYSKWVNVNKMCSWVLRAVLENCQTWWGGCRNPNLEQVSQKYGRAPRLATGIWAREGLVGSDANSRQCQNWIQLLDTQFMLENQKIVCQYGKNYTGWQNFKYCCKASNNKA